MSQNSDHFANLRAYADIVPLPFCIIKCADRTLQLTNASWLDLMKVDSDTTSSSLEKLWPELYHLPILSMTAARSSEKNFYTVNSISLTPPQHVPESTTQYFDLTIKALSLWDHQDYLCILATQVSDEQ